MALDFSSFGWRRLGAPVPSVNAQSCPDVEVVFARGTTEDPGVGPTGQAFVDSLRAQIGPRSMNVYPVDYPATTDFPTAVDGIRDASAHIEAMARNCPATNLVLGGFSQGAAVMGFVTANVIPDGAPEGVPNPMPPDVADHVAAVALFGKPNERFMHAIGQPTITVGPQYAGKTIDLCVPDDFVCSSGRDFNAHTQYMAAGHGRPGGDVHRYAPRAEAPSGRVAAGAWSWRAAATVTASSGIASGVRAGTACRAGACRAWPRHRNHPRLRRRRASTPCGRYHRARCCCARPRVRSSGPPERRAALPRRRISDS